MVLHFDYPEATKQSYIYPRRNWWYGGDIDTLERVLKLCPETNFLGHAPGFWCHISNDDEGRTKSKPTGPVVRGDKIEQFLDKYPNLYCDCSAKSGTNALRRDPEYSEELIMAHPDRFVFARDNFESELIELVESFDLPEDVREKFYCKNMLKLIHMEED